MKEYVYITGEDASPLLLLELDKRNGTATIKITHGGATRTYEYSGVNISHGMPGGDSIYWVGSKLAVTQLMHCRFKDEFPSTDLDAEYQKADDWLHRKKRECKGPLAFMLNWLKRSRGGAIARGGVVV